MDLARRMFGEEDYTDSQLRMRLAMFLFAWLAQFATILATWQLWCVRQSPPNLPLVSLPEVSLGPFILFSLFAALAVPRWGVVVHGAALVIACVFDQHRLEPQFLGNWILLWACVDRRGAWLGRWFLAAMWLWAGLHKFLSPEWLGLTSWQITKRCGLDPDWHLPLGVVVASTEVLVGVLAAWTRRPTAIACFLLHGGILVFLSPWLYNSNVSVWPWNAATAIVGAWLFWAMDVGPPRNRFAWIVVLFLYVFPATYYFGWINPHLAHVLYSSHMPKGWISGQEDIKKLHGWGGLQVPFPDSHALFVQTFERTGRAGDKLYIQDPRRLVDDRYFVLGVDRKAREISRSEFRQENRATGGVAGQIFDDANAAFMLTERGAMLERSAARQVRSLTVRGSEFNDRDLARVARLPNLRELRLSGTRITGMGLGRLDTLDQLEILVVQDTKLADKDLAVVARLPRLQWLGLNQTDVRGTMLDQLTHPELIEVLHLAATPLTQQSLRSLSRFEQLTWLDLSGTSIDNQTIESYAALRKCVWLDLSETDIDDDAVAALRQMTWLEILDLRETGISPTGINELRQSLPECRVKR